MAHYNGKDQVVDKLANTRGHIGAEGEARKVILFEHAAERLVERGVNHGRNEHCQRRAQHHVPGATDGGVKGSVDLDHARVVVGAPHAGRERACPKAQAHGQVDQQREDRDFDGCLGAKALADHVLAQKRDPAHHKAAIECQIRQADELFVGQQVHHDDTHEKQRNRCRGNAPQQDLVVLHDLLDHYVLLWF